MGTVLLVGRGSLRQLGVRAPRILGRPQTTEEAVGRIAFKEYTLHL